MARGQKECPKCNHPCGPRTKVCEQCKYVYFSDSEKSVADELEGDTVKPGIKACSNCGKDFESIRYGRDPYGKITYYYRYDSYCSTSCLEAADERKSDLIFELLDKITESDHEDLVSFIKDKEKEDDYASLIKDIINRKIKEEEEIEYQRTHPLIVFQTPPRKKITTVRDMEEEGLKIQPKVGEYKEAEPEISPLARMLRGEDVDLSDNDSDEEEEENSEEDSDDEIESITPPGNPLSALLGLIPSSNTTTTIAPTNITSQIDTTKYPWDNTPNRQGQKKCKGCGKVNGVRAKTCSRCGKSFK